MGVAMGAGKDVARESADVVLIGNDLMKFVETVRVARNCRTIIASEFLRHPDRRYDRHRFGRGWNAESINCSLYPCCLRADVHPEFDAPASVQGKATNVYTRLIVSVTASVNR